MDLFMNEIYCTEQSFDSITFFSIVLFFCVKLAIPTKKVYFRRLYLQSLNQVYKKHANFLLEINILKAHWTHYRLVANNLFNSIAISLFRFLSFVDYYTTGLL